MHIQTFTAQTLSGTNPLRMGETFSEACVRKSHCPGCPRPSFSGRPVLVRTIVLSDKDVKLSDRYLMAEYTHRVI
jgi:hypothetical protein